MFAVALAAVVTTSVPFVLRDHRVIVQAFAGRVGPLSMIVDTGSDGLLITPETARRLKVTVSSAGFIGGAGPGRAIAGSATVPELQLGSIRYDRAPATVADLSRIRRGIGLPRLDGVIGYDQLKSYRVVIDMDHRHVVLSSAPIATAKNASVTRFTDSNGLLSVAAAVDGVHGDFVVDTGDRSSLTLFRPFAQANDFFHFATVRNALTGFGIGGPLYADLLRTTLQAFGTMANDVVTRLPLAHAGAFSSPAYAGSIGNGFLERFNVVYDYPDSEMISWPVRTPIADSSTFRLPYVPSSSTGALARHALFGAAASLKAGGVTLTFVAPNGPAFAAGLRTGDVLRAMNGRTIATTSDFYEAVHDATGRATVRVDFVRDGRPHQVDVALATAADESADGLVTRYGQVVVDNSLRRTIVTLPSGVTRPLPAVLMVGGIGCYSVDVAANAQDPYLRLAHDLARDGYVVIRLEKSGLGDSQGPPCANVDFDAEVRGYEAALASVLTDASVNAHRIFLFGHSIGSVIVPRMAHGGKITGVIVAEAVGRDWPEYEIRNARRELELSRGTPSDVDQALIEKAQCMQKLLFDDQPESEIEAVMPSCKVHDGVYPVTAWYVRQVAPLNVIEPWTTLDVPVLAIYGNADFVTELADHQRIVDVVNARHPGSATLITIDGMSHFLGRAASQQAAMEHYNDRAAETYDTDLSDAIVAWLKTRG